QNPLLAKLTDLQNEIALQIAEQIDNKDWRIKEIDPVTGQLIFNCVLPTDVRIKYERALRACLDTAGKRIDPWVTGFAWQRLKQHSHSSRHNHRLAVYGWVDGPFAGNPGPTKAGLLHTPSYAQTITSLVLRDKYLSYKQNGYKNEDQHDPWVMNMTSKKIRLAEEMAEEVRLGFHIYEVIGRRVEAVINDHQTIKKLRSSSRYAMHKDRKDPNEVCNGKEALYGLLKEDEEFPIPFAKRSMLSDLKAALDTYSEMLMAEGVMHLVNRKPEHAANAMDATAGFKPPPTFEFIQTPPSGYQLETMVVAALPFVSVASLAENTHPIRIADPSVASFVENKLGTSWAWKAINTDAGEDENNLLGTVTLETIGVSFEDSFSYPSDLLNELARLKLQLPLATLTELENRTWKLLDEETGNSATINMLELGILPKRILEMPAAELHEEICTRLNMKTRSILEEQESTVKTLWVATDENENLLAMIGGDAIDTIQGETTNDLRKMVRKLMGIPNVKIIPPREASLSKELVSALGNRPAAGRDLTYDKDIQTIDTDIYTELLERYQRLHKDCKQLVRDISTGVIDKGKLLRKALSWGVSPSSNPKDRKTLLAVLLNKEPGLDATSLDNLLKNILDTLNDRLSNSVVPEVIPTSATIGKPLDSEIQNKKDNIPDGVPSLARAIVQLAAPEAKLSVLACWQTSDFISKTKIEKDHAENIDTEWLTMVAATRPGLARLEALQLELLPELPCWTNSYGDPWQKGEDGVIQNNLKSRKAPESRIDIKRFVAAYGAIETWTGDKIAVGMIDAFNETIPLPQRKTSAAFGFNAPAARAPQAILLAVPPKPEQRIDNDLLLKIVHETRELSHARMICQEDMAELQSCLPTVWLQSSGPARVRLEPFPLYTI
ncbi:MAG: hypothetical protein J7497_04255, partial [Chitinophagaceae bacterium]|nr:hypothetical protein [Chitinophagaceae bacterium]